MKISYEQQAGGYLQLLLEASSFPNFIRRLEMITKWNCKKCQTT